MLVRIGILFLLLGAVPVTLSCAQLNGNYTIDPAGSGAKNYTTIGAAVSALTAGVSGPVVFTVASTTFKETVNLKPVTGASATNTITFIAAGSAAVIDANGGQDGVTLADLCAHFILDNLNITNFTRYGLYLAGASASKMGVNLCQFLNLVVEAAATTSSSTRAMYLVQSDSNTFTNCVFRGGGYTVYHSQCDKNVYEGCEMDGKGQATYAAYFINNNDSDNVIQNCFLHGVRNATSTCAFGMQASSHGNMVLNNTIICTTSGAAVKMGGFWTAYTRADAFKNNIIVNLGTGVCVDFRIWNQGTSPPNKVSTCVSDYNCYYLPNSANTISVTNLSGGAKPFQGSLSAWLTWQKNNPNYFVPGGPNPYDGNSIESDPALVSLQSPMDIHLKSISPCLDSGTFRFIESYQSFNQNHKVTTDFEGHTRGTQIDIGADELATSIIGSGSTAPGSRLDLNLNAPGDGGLVYQVASSLAGGPIPIGNRKLGLSLGPLMDATVNGYLWWIFKKYGGVLDAQGKGLAWINIPNSPVMKGLRVYTAFLTFKASAPMGIQSISTTFIFTIG